MKQPIMYDEDDSASIHDIKSSFKDKRVKGQKKAGAGSKYSESEQSESIKTQEEFKEFINFKKKDESLKKAQSLKSKQSNGQAEGSQSENDSLKSDKVKNRSFLQFFAHSVLNDRTSNF